MLVASEHTAYGGSMNILSDKLVDVLVRVPNPQDISFCAEHDVSADEPPQETQHNIVLVRGTRIVQLNMEPGAVHSNPLSSSSVSACARSLRK